MSAFVARAYGYTYEDGVCREDLCYVTEDGGVSLDLSQAMRYESEADLWEHVINAGFEAEDIEKVENV